MYVEITSAQTWCASVRVSRGLYAADGQMIYVYIYVWRGTLVRAGPPCGQQLRCAVTPRQTRSRVTSKLVSIDVCYNKVFQCTLSGLFDIYHLKEQQVMGPGYICININEIIIGSRVVIYTYISARDFFEMESEILKVAKLKGTEN